jgi:hypothetical protein
MFDVILMLEQLQRNPILGGAISLVLSGFVLWGLTKAPFHLVRLVRRFLFNELVFDNAMEHGQWRAYEAALVRISQEPLSMVLSGRATPAKLRRRTLGKHSALGPATGSLYMLRFCGTFLFFRMAVGATFGQNQAIKLSVFVPIWAKVTPAEVAESLLELPEKMQVTYVSAEQTSLTGMQRPLSACVHAAGLVDSLVGQIERFRNEHAQYAARGEQHKLVILLHGPVGTGKSSLAYALASHFAKELTIVDLEHVAPDVFLRTCTGGFILAEEVDALAIACTDQQDVLKAVDSSKSVSRQLLWQWLSGGIPHSGSVIFLTTNHKDKLHPALLRDSRVDRDVYIGNWHAAEVQQFLRQHCADLNVKPAWLGALDKLSDFPGALADTEFPSGASIKQLLSETPINDVLPAILRKWPALTLTGMCADVPLLSR